MCLPLVGIEMVLNYFSVRLRLCALNRRATMRRFNFFVAFLLCKTNYKSLFQISFWGFRFCLKSKEFDKSDSDVDVSLMFFWRLTNESVSCWWSPLNGLCQKWTIHESVFGLAKHVDVHRALNLTAFRTLLVGRSANLSWMEEPFCVFGWKRGEAKMLKSLSNAEFSWKDIWTLAMLFTSYQFVPILKTVS